MIILALSTSSKSLSVAVSRDNDIIFDFTLNNGLKHSAYLMETIDLALKMTGFSINEIDLFVVDVGPGSFTGIRIGISTVKGLCFMEGKRAVAVSSLECLYSGVDIKGYVCPLINAQGNDVYYALFKDGKKILKENMVNKNELDEALKRATNNDIIFIDEDYILKASNMVNYALNNMDRIIDAKDLSPMYIKKSAAQYVKEERERNSIINENCNIG